MRTVEVSAELIGSPESGPLGMPSDKYFEQMGQVPPGAQTVPGYPGEEQQQEPYSQQGGGEYFQRANDLRVIQEYNTEELVPTRVKENFWGLMSKSIKLGFWEPDDEQAIFFHKNIIKVGHIMSMPKHHYTFKERQEMNMMDLLTYADFKRGVGMERYRINERTLQATSVTQNIQGGVGGGGRKGGMLANLKSFFS